MRRRRSRVLSEEDDNSLMDFLRSSGHDNGSRERKPSSYGSLDRSWARRARSGSSTKKRPDLLNIDFGADRERPHSPSTSSIAENSSQPSASGDDVRPRFVYNFPLTQLHIFTNDRFGSTKLVIDNKITAENSENIRLFIAEFSAIMLNKLIGI